MRWIIEQRDVALRPLARLATNAGISPIMASGAGLVAMLLFAGFAQQGWLALAVLPMAVSIFLDFFDGTLARYQGTASERGRKIDLAVDTTNFVLFAAGMTLEKLWHPLSSVVLVAIYVVAIGLGVRRARHAGDMTDARGFWVVPTTLKYALYGLYGTQALTYTWVVPMNYAAIAAAILLGIYVVIRGR